MFISTRDRIKIKIGDVEVLIKPLSVAEKAEVQGLFGLVANGNLGGSMLGVSRAVQFSLKSIKGLKDDEGNDLDFELEFDDKGNLSEDCVSDLFNMPVAVGLSNIASNLLNGINSKKIVDADGKAIKGIKFVEVVKGKK